MQTIRKNIWIATGVALCVGLLLLSILYIEQRTARTLTAPEVSNHQVILTAEGFYPAEITIRKGDTVTFSTQREKPFWPASSFHPTHFLYADFDPEKPVLPSDEWSFVFDREGVWTYHDHLDPQRTGEVNVLSGWNLFPKKHVPCEDLSGSEKMRCFDQELKERLATQGIDAAFDYFKEIYPVHPEVAQECHDWMHTLGELEYASYAEGSEVTLQEEASLCGYGYYHGFINAMVAQTQSILSAQEFCAQAAARIEHGGLSIQESCIHGIGHSVATLALESQIVWGDIKAVLEDASIQCEKLYPDSPGTCLDGMFHELYGSIARGDYGMTPDAYMQSNDLFFYCRDMEGLLAESCYSEFIKLWPYVLGEDKIIAMQNIITDTSDVLTRFPRVLRSLARSFIEIDLPTGEFTQSVAACALVSPALLEGCIHGLAIGFVTHGEPDAMHEAGFAFCIDHYQGTLMHMCLKDVVIELRARYTPQRVSEACEELSEEYRPAVCTQQ